MEARRETETTEVFSMVLGFILAKTLCPQRHSKVCFELLETFWITPKRTCLSVICSSVVGQLRWKEHIKKYKKFLIFLINKLDFISLRKIRNNDRTIEYIIQAADIHFGWTFWGSERQGEIGGSVACSVQATRVDCGYTAQYLFRDNLEKVMRLVEILNYFHDRPLLSKSAVRG